MLVWAKGKDWSTKHSWTVGIRELSFWIVCAFGHTEMAMVQTKSSRGQCYIYFTDIALVLSVSVCFNDRFEGLTICQYKWGIILVDYTWSLKWFSSPLCCFFKGNVMNMPHLLWWNSTFLYLFHLFPKRHSVLCASELLIICGFIVCVVRVTDYCWAF